jgi:hypothetical protein
MDELMRVISHNEPSPACENTRNTTKSKKVPPNFSYPFDLDTSLHFDSHIPKNTLLEQVERLFPTKQRSGETTIISPLFGLGHNSSSTPIGSEFVY